jgi:hypothetical protein
VTQALISAVRQKGLGLTKRTSNTASLIETSQAKQYRNALMMLPRIRIKAIEAV